MHITELTTQNLSEPLGLGSEKPLLSWRLFSENAGDVQSAYQILAATERSLLKEEKADLWDSGWTEDSRNYAIPYEGGRLCSRQRVYWKVRVKDAWGKASAWSEETSFEMGLNHEKEWKGVWIGRGDDFTGDKSCAPALVGHFHVDNLEQLRRARLYISGLGLFAASLNGQKFSELYEPGESEFNRRVYYVTYDIFPFLREGENALGVVLGNGQYVNYAVNPVMQRGDGTLDQRHRYQKNDGIYLKEGICGDAKLLAQVELTRNDGSIELALVSDSSWLMADSAVVFQNWYGGEDYDGVKAAKMRGWDCPGADLSGWSAARQMRAPAGKLSAKEFPPVRIWERWEAKSVTPLPENRWLVDMGKNSAGFVRLILRDTEQYGGRKIELYPAEVLSEERDGVDQASCTQSCDTFFDCCVKDSYVIAGTGEETWHPIFCYHGFQYVEVRGFPGTPETWNFEGCAVRLMNPKTGEFGTDNKILNRIEQITDRSIASNMMFSFTDCPQIEKLGWMETTQLMFSSLAAGYDIQSWMRKIILDIRDAQVKGQEKPISWDADRYPGFDFDKYQNRESEPVGFVPAIAPEYFRINGLYKDPNWGGAIVLTPWYYYMEYGDSGILRENFEAMRSYMEYLENQSKDGVLDGYAQMGDWGEIKEQTPVVLVATCSFYLLTSVMVRIANVLGEKASYGKYTCLAEKIQKGFYRNSDCWNEMERRCGNGSQASYGCVLFSGIARSEDREYFLTRLDQAVEERGYHLSSGEVGLKQVFSVLAENGKNDVVYRMVMNETEPSYRRHIEEGLTTLPEYWNYTELWHGLGRSRNHAMMGHVKEWLSRFVLGIMPMEPGYAKVRIRPYLRESIHRLRGCIDTVRGTVSLELHRRGRRTIMKVRIPVGMEAEVWLPCGRQACCRLDGKRVDGVCSDGYRTFSDMKSGYYVWTAEEP